MGQFKSNKRIPFNKHGRLLAMGLLEILYIILISRATDVLVKKLTKSKENDKDNEKLV